MQEFLELPYVVAKLGRDELGAGLVLETQFGVLQKGKPFKSGRAAADYGYAVAGERLDKIDGDIFR